MVEQNGVDHSEKRSAHWHVVPVATTFLVLRSTWIFVDKYLFTGLSRSVNQKDVIFRNSDLDSFYFLLCYYSNDGNEGLLRTPRGRTTGTPLWFCMSLVQQMWWEFCMLLDPENRLACHGRFVDYGNVLGHEVVFWVQNDPTTTHMNTEYRSIL